MDKNNRTLLHLLFSKYHSRQSEALWKHLPPAWADQQRIQPMASSDMKPFFGQYLTLVATVHYSWLVDPLKRLDSQKRSLLLGIFPEEIAAKLKGYLGRSQEKASLTDLGKWFFATLFARELFQEAPLPCAYLPQTKLGFLAQLGKLDLVKLIDFLGIYDLAEEIQYVVDRKLLDHVYKAIGKTRQLFLQKCLHQKEKMVSQRLRLDQWNGDAETLLKLLHQKGITRLGYALSGEDRDLIWHIAHRLDTGRGQKLVEFCLNEAIPGVTETLTKQILNTSKFLNTVGG